MFNGQQLKKTAYIAVITAASFMAIVGGFYAFTFSKYRISLDPEKWGQFGDYFGGILNPVIALLAFAALLATIILQHEELNNAIYEIEETKKLIISQNFENGFFILLNAFLDTKRNLKTKEAYGEYIGLEALDKINNIIITKLRETEEEEAKNTAKKILNTISGMVYGGLPQYIESVNAIINYIQDETTNKIDKNKYINILKSFIDWREIGILLLYGVTDVSFKNFCEQNSFFNKRYKHALTHFSKLLSLYNANACSNE